MVYKYGMRLRGFSPGCQPKDGLIGCTGEESRQYYDFLLYSRKLTEKELNDYELDFIEEVQ